MKVLFHLLNESCTELVKWNTRAYYFPLIFHQGKKLMSKSRFGTIFSHSKYKIERNSQTLQFKNYVHSICYFGDTETFLRNKEQFSVNFV